MNAVLFVELTAGKKCGQVEPLGSQFNEQIRKACN
jgi:hypothetical protein